MTLAQDGEPKCGEVRVGITGIEWVCVRTPHDSLREWANHYFVNRWPKQGVVRWPHEAEPSPPVAGRP